MDHRQLRHKLSPSHIVPDTVYRFEALDACPHRRSVTDGFLYWTGGDRSKHL